MRTPSLERKAAPIIDPPLLETPAEFSLLQAIDLRTLNDAQMRDRCRSLARAGGSEREIAAALRWNVAMVRRALSPERSS